MRKLVGHKCLLVALDAVAIAWPLDVEEDRGWVCKLI